MPFAWRYDGKDNHRDLCALLLNYHKGTHTRDPTDRHDTWADREWARQQPNILLFDNVASRVILSDGQKKWAKQLFNQLDYRRYEVRGSEGRGMVAVALVACAYVGWKSGLECHPNSSEMNRWFREALEIYDISDEKFAKYFGRFQSDIERRNHLITRPFDDREPDLVDSYDDEMGGI